MTDIGIKSYAAYVPRLRMDRASIAAAHAWAMPSLRGLGKGERSFCSWDEDSITMSVEAVRGLLRGTSNANVRAVSFASTTPVFSDLQNASLVATASGLAGDLSTLDVIGLAAGRDVGADPCARVERRGGDAIVGRGRRWRVMRSPAASQEMQYGAGVRALLIGDRHDLIARYLGSVSTANAVRRSLPRRGPEVRLPVGGALDPRRGLPQDRARDGRRRLLEQTGRQASGAIDYFCLVVDPLRDRGGRRQAPEAASPSRSSTVRRALRRHRRRAPAAAARCGA